MKTMFVLSLLFSTSVMAQETGVAQPLPLEKNEAPAAVIAPAPLEMDVSLPATREPLPKPAAESPVARVDKLYNEIKSSKLFLEINPLRMAGASVDFESNQVTMQNNRELELDGSEFKLKLMPLDFKFGFENEGWGSFAEVEIEDGEENSELVVYAKVNGHKFGGGLGLNVTDVEATARSNNVQIAKEELRSTVIYPYFYASFGLVDDAQMIVEQSNKIGGSFEKAESDTASVEGVAFVFQPSLDVLFKVNPKLLIGFGGELSYRRFSGDIKSSGTNIFGGVGNTFGFEFNLIKTRFVF
ncbi:hypothetical protein DOM21_15535 [Bacteriovorax stolpii]|uniref:Uncharacterized protein n=1 Tax=Bacteriovorax stolpii TaxID=960 RepID=A0A2K9NQ98_BACTC|nr:hypothetical protein [Bacteriovorax stolpii]AUN97225.1 hypothetical protein C0V70_03690 [Bacteriovorax stolpii]QDK42836.1 hypothetical protein DOM21_15535 [Bacteriovorax stolpii]TDP53514.1 hypothetical protein C8D79_2158 [Bacteriovorax stolpii]